MNDTTASGGGGGDEASNATFDVDVGAEGAEEGEGGEEVEDTVPSFPAPVFVLVASRPRPRPVSGAVVL